MQDDLTLVVTGAAGFIGANLVKARTTDQQLLDTILGLAGRRRHGGNATDKE